MKNFIQILLFIIFAVSVAGLMGFIYFEQGKQPINQVVIEMNQVESKGFLNTTIIKELIADFDSLEHKKVNQVDTESTRK